MKKRCLVMLALAGVLSSGCRHSPYLNSHVQLMNAEKRAIEDQLYDLEFEFEDAMKEVNKLRLENDRLRANSGLPSAEPGRSRTRGDRSSTPDLSPPMIEPGSLEPRIEMPAEPPANDLPTPTPATPPPGRPAIPPMPPQSSGKSRDQKARVSVEAPNHTLTLEPADPRVTHIFLNQLLTGGSDFDREPGDDGIVVVIEPRNRDEAFVPLAGPISVVVLDPAKTPEQGRIVARWDVTANEAQQLLQNTPASRGIHLRLHWPNAKPNVSRLHLYVRYLTVDNRDLRADREIFLTLSGQFSQRWTPRAAPREGTAAPVAPAASAVPSARTEPQTAQPEWRPYR